MTQIAYRSQRVTAEVPDATIVRNDVHQNDLHAANTYVS